MKKKKFDIRTLRSKPKWGLLLGVFFLLAVSLSANGQVLVSEDFSGPGLPTGWDTSDLTGDGNWVFDNPGGRTISGGAPGFDTSFAIFDSDHLCGSNEDATLTTPTFDASTNSIVLEFDNSFHNFGSQEGHVEVWDGSTWNDVLTLSGSSDGYPTANRKVIDITTAAGGATAAKVRFHWENGSCDWWWAIDNVVIKRVSCFRSTVLSSENIVDVSATISWNIPSAAPANGYDYYYATTATAPTTTTVPSGSTTDTFANLSGLTPSTTYYYWVRSVCSSVDHSEWTIIDSFKTQDPMQTPATLPYNEDFTSNDWTLVNGTEVNQWYVGNAVGNPGQSLYVTDDGGTTNHYDNSTSAIVQAYRDIAFPSGGATFSMSFDWQCLGEGFSSYNYDYFRVWIVPVTYVPTAGTSVSAANSGGIQIGGNINNSDNWDTAQFVLPSSLSGTTSRLIFEWRNDGGSGAQPPAAIDNIQIEEISCSTPLNPAVANLTTNSATLMWDSLSSMPSNGFEYYYNTSGTAPTAATAASGTATDTFANISGLTPNTQYYIWVRSACGSTNFSDWSAMVSFHTYCTAASIPFFEGFETGYTDGDDIVGCWIQQMIAKSWKANSSSTSYNRSPRTGTWDATLQYNGESWLFREMQLTGGVTYQLTFYARQNSSDSSDANISAYFGSDASADSMQFTVIPQTGLTSGDYQKFFEYFTPATSGSYVLGIRGYINSSPWYITLDDISVDAAPTCIKPTAVAASSITTTGAVIAWQPSVTVPGDGYDYYYNTTGTVPTAATTPNGTTMDTFATLTGLVGNTTYSVWVRAHCSATDKSEWTDVVAFTTECDAATVPYYMPLSTTTVPALPECVRDQLINPTGIWETVDDPGYGFTGITLRCHYTSSGSGPADDWIYTRGLILTAGTSYTLHYRYGNNSSSSFQENLAVKYGMGATADSMLTLLADHLNINDATAHDTTISFTPATSGTYYIGFQSHSDENEYYLFVDSIYVIETPLCTAPDTLHVANITDGSADLSWNGTAANYTLEYGTTGFSIGTGTTVSVSGNAYTINNLDPKTGYDFYVRAICTPGSDSSNYSAVTSFQTICNTVTVALGNDTAICANSTILLDAGNPGSDYLWNDNSTNQTLSVSQPGDYSVTVTNTFGCSGADTISILAGTEPIVALGADTTLCSGDTITLDAGNPGADYVWNDNSTNQTLDVTAAGDYSVTVTSVTGCTASDTITITAGVVPIVDLGADTAICAGDTITLDAGNAGSDYLWTDNSTNQTLDVNTADAYGVTVTSSDGCVAGDTINIAINPLPTANAIHVTDHGDGSFTFRVNGAANVAGYSWDFGDNSAPKTNDTVAHTYTASGTYTVTLVISNACGTDTLTKEVHATVGIDKVVLGKEQLKIYPNPAHDHLTILNSSNLTMEQITVYNVLGQVVYRVTPDNSREFKMSVSSMSSGLYTVRIKTNAGFVMRKFEVNK